MDVMRQRLSSPLPTFRSFSLLFFSYLAPFNFLADQNGSPSCGSKAPKYSFITITWRKPSHLRQEVKPQPEWQEEESLGRNNRLLQRQKHSVVCKSLVGAMTICGGMDTHATLSSFGLSLAGHKATQLDLVFGHKRSYRDSLTSGPRGWPRQGSQFSLSADVSYRVYFCTCLQFLSIKSKPFQGFFSAAPVLL